ncbi:hypothetical protein ACFPOA_06630 [Lysobacter niabensis]|uniref:hypothetical protein n=1 Tax=Agrilutibacter niabensis TaxID=380628 RepID=UPI00361D7BE4
MALLLMLLGILAAVSALASELPWFAALPLAVLSVAYGAWLGRREFLRPTCSLVIPFNDTVATIDGVPMGDLQLRWRGPLAFLEWRDANGGRQRLQGWPDNLAADARRELRLAMAARLPAQSPRSMAP